MKIKIFLIGLFLSFKALSITTYAADLTVVLDLSKYDAFNETIELQYQNQNDEGAVAVLNQFNGYQHTMDLDKGIYQFVLSVRNDSLNLIHLDPAQFTVDMQSEENQIVTIAISDTGGMGVDANINVHSQYEEIAVKPPVYSVKRYRTENQRDNTEIGTLTITAPEVSGIESLTYSLKNEEGKILSYVLHKDNQFKAVIELPFGIYIETGSLEVTSAEEIKVPKDIIFSYEYYKSNFGNRYNINKNNRAVSNPADMQLWAEIGDVRFRVTNLYRFSGDLTSQNAVSETGHVSFDNEILKPVQDMDMGLETEETDIKDVKNNSYFSFIALIFVLMATGIMSIVLALKNKGNEGKP